MSNDAQSNKSLNQKFLWIGIVIVVVVVAGAWFAFSGVLSGNETATANTTAAESALEPLPKAGHPAPEFTLKNLEGEEVSLTDFRGQAVILNFWATWCGPCRVEMPEFQEAFTELKDDGLVIVGVNLTERDDPEDVPAFLEEFGLTFPIVLDENGEVAETYNVFGQPASIFIDKEGTVHTVFYGPVNKAFIEARIAEILNS